MTKKKQWRIGAEDGTSLHLNKKLDGGGERTALTCGRGYSRKRWGELKAFTNDVM